MILAITEFAFLIFLFLSLIIYWFTKKWPNIQNLILLAICYLFYGYGAIETVVFLIISTIFNYSTGVFLDISQSVKCRKFLLRITVAVNLLYLGVLKYYNFFAGQIQSLLSIFGIALDPLLLSVLLPAGFSFFTFQVISYNIDVYRHTIPCTRDFVTFALFVAYFPKLIAGSIEKSSHLIPQLTAKKTLKVEDINSGFQLMFLGYFFKSVIADKIGLIIGNFYSNPLSYGSLEAYIITWFYTIQIYADFAGYTNIIRGVSKLFGIDLMENFNQPYLAQNPRDFWQAVAHLPDIVVAGVPLYPARRQSKGLPAHISKYLNSIRSFRVMARGGPYLNHVGTFTRTISSWASRDSGLGEKTEF